MTEFLGSSKSMDGGISAKQRSISFTELQEVGIASTLDVESVVDMESDVDLEHPVMHEGMSWAEVASGDGIAVNTDKAGSTWADKVSNVALPLSESMRDDDISMKVTATWDKSLTAANVAVFMTTASSATTSTITDDATTMSLNLGGGALLSSSKGLSLNHRAEVPPIFLAYRQVCNEGQRLPLAQVATSIIQAMGTHAKLDAIQPKQTGWNIYMCTLLNHTQLIEKGIHLISKFVLLCSESQAGAQ